MKDEAVARRITKSWETTNFREISPVSLPPYWSPQKDEDGDELTGDRHYFIQGEIIAFTAITIFVIFLLFLIVPFIRRATGAVPAQEYSGKRKSCLLLMLREKRDEQDTSSSDHEKNYYGAHQRWSSS
ncbi:hypothetical protein ACH5RR_010239 [Cinchona calisaya]|uniref:Uncharacterized protein n=1 Tax=Cinchona calisaya TaxID=153742 RepID=A0ABD3AI45_9GENT